jgi:hypothetical protein
MLKLYFGSIPSTISTVLVIIFCVFFGLVMNKRTQITHWGILVLLMFLLGLFMSMMSGFKDGTGTPNPVIPNNHWGMTVLCILGGIAFLVAIVALFVRKQDFWQISFYILSSVIIVKTLLTEVIRIVAAFRH